MRAPSPASSAARSGSNNAVPVPERAPAAAFPGSQLAPLTEGLQFWQAGSNGAMQAMLDPLLSTLAQHFRVVFVALAVVVPPAVRGGPVYRISSLLPSVLAETTRRLAAQPGRPVVVCLVTTGLESRLGTFAAALPPGVGGVAFGTGQGTAGLPIVGVAQTAAAWAFTTDGRRFEIPLCEGKLVVDRPRSASPADGASSARAARQRRTGPASSNASLFTRAPAAPLVPNCIPAPSEGLAVWVAGSPAAVTALTGPVLAQLAEHHRVLFVGPATSQPKPVRGGPVYTTSRLLPTEVLSAVVALQRQPGRPLAVCFAGGNTERRLGEYAAVLPVGIGGVALVPAPIEATAGTVALPQVRCEARPEGWMLTGNLGSSLVSSSWRGFAPLP